ncbi:hypothetical protein B0H15DRAFT_865136 [Mycena belliarum]|uniref:Small ribosomal subunit protein uS10 domain-containing protein n=1 Tax=Mycena belliarum TaxID=1033014 RepID=A0AAD6TVG4_9AGAR|nr:hypothetical protein B0H15DRAFT_865136 [Mycena belliae]
MFLAALARPARRIAACLPVPRAYAYAYSTVTPIDHKLRRQLQAQRDSETDAGVRGELDKLLDAPTPPPVPEDGAGEVDFDVDFDLTGGPGPQHASLLEPQEVGSTAQDLFGFQERNTLQTLPDGFDTRRLPLPGPLPATYTEVEYAATVVPGRSIHRPFRHPRTHALPAAQIQFRSHDTLTLSLFVHFATHAATALGIPCSRAYSLPTRRQLWTVLRGPFAHKKSQENFERRVHRRGLKAWDADPKVVDLWFAYLRRHALGGVGMRCVKWERVPMGVGREARGKVIDAIHRERQAAATSKAKIRLLGERIVREEMSAIEAAPAPDGIRTVVQEQEQPQ